MKNASETKRRLNAARQTRQITNAMYLLSSSAMRRYLSGVGYTAEYLRRLEQTKNELIPLLKEGNPFIGEKPGTRSVYLIISSEKGLCGSYNRDITEVAISCLDRAYNPYIIIKGANALSTLSAKGYFAYECPEYPGNAPSTEYADSIAESICDLYLSDGFSAVYVIYTEYVSMTYQRAVCKKLLPLGISGGDASKMEHFDFMHSEDEVFSNLIDHYIRGFLYSAMYESFVCENISRMNAMKSATDNADSMIDKLKATYNASRQLAITLEVCEIASATEHANSTEETQ